MKTRDVTRRRTGGVREVLVAYRVINKNRPQADLETMIDIFTGFMHWLNKSRDVDDTIHKAQYIANLAEAHFLAEYDADRKETP